MNAVVKEFLGEEGTVYKTDVKEPTPGYGQVKIKVMAAAICGTDIHSLYHNAMAERYNMPVVIGHEGAGIVVEVGEGVKNLKVGDRVTAETALTLCGSCEYCRTSQTNVCTERKGLGTATHGYFAQYTIQTESSCHKLADHVSYEVGALSEPFSCAVHATCIRTNPKPGDIVLVSGPGPIGAMVAAIAKKCGCIVVLSGITSDEKRMKYIQEHYDVDYIVDSTKTDLKQLILDITNGYGADIVYECSGSKAAILSGLDICKRQGTFITVGIYYGEVPIDFYPYLFTKELNILGDKATNTTTWVRSMRMINNKIIDLNPMITKKFPLPQWKEGFELARSGDSMKVILLPQEE